MSPWENSLFEEPVPFAVWGADDLDEAALDQMRNACRLPVSVRGAQMPDGHVGYGLPIGGVLATENAVIPYAVGVDIACRMKLSVLDIPAADMKRLNVQLVRALERETKFGVGATWKTPLDHDVLEEDWRVTPLTGRLFDKARAQLGTSGSGNHFVEFGILTVNENAATAPSSTQDSALSTQDFNTFNLPPGKYLALLSHSGSRGSGATVADRYSKLAMDLHPELPPELRRLAWLDLDSEPGQEYWAAMNLMGHYAHANHAIIHQKIVKALKAEVLAGVENHHNFAWKERHGDKDLYVHRKGATPAAKGVLGVIPGSMADPAFVVRGKGGKQSFDSASHGAGRRMSRTAAFGKYNFRQIQKDLAAKGVHVLSAGADEVPYVYKNILDVMSEQADLVDIVGRFDPRIVKMCGDGSKAED